MRKLLIIDDEPIVREGLQRVIPWTDYGYKICGVGEDGRDGLNKIRLHQPDLVLLDIRMPGFSGIDVVQQVQKEGYTSKFIILSGYSSFSYAKESIKLGISSYLLKPVDEEELVQAIEDVSLEITQEENIHDQLSLYKHMTEEESFKKLLDGNWNVIQPAILKELENHRFQVALFLEEPGQDDWLWIRRKVKKYNKQMKLITKEGRLHLVCIDMDESNVKDLINGLVAKWRNFPVMLGCRVTNYKDICKSYYQTKQLIDVHFCHSDEQILTYEWLEEQKIDTTEKINKQLIYRYMEFNEYQSIRSELSKLEAYYQMNRFSRERIKAEVVDFTISVFRLIKEKNPSLEISPQNRLIDQVFKQNNLQELIEFIYKELVDICQNLNGYITSSENMIEKIEAYINQYYYEEDLSLKVLADLFNYNSAYLGKKFKKQTGQNFNTYLDLTRIDNAKLMLTNGQNKVYEVSEQVGYCNIDYFYKKFKKYVGMSPKEYQKSHNESDELTNSI